MVRAWLSDEIMNRLVDGDCRCCGGGEILVVV